MNYKEDGNKKVCFSEPLRWYLEQGISVIPLKPESTTKEPLIPWREYQNRKPTIKEMVEWCEQTKRFAIVCGEVSGNLAVIDIDKEELFAGLNLGVVAARTYTEDRKGKKHIFLRTTRPIKHQTLRFEGEEDISIRFNGDLVIAGGTSHPSGGAYTHFLTSPKKIAVVEPGFFEDLEKLWRDYRGLNKDDKKSFAGLRKGITLKVPILEIIRGCAELKELRDYGDYYTCRCPFPEHKDLRPSFTIYKKTNSYYCFGCNRGGNAINFIKDFYGVSKKEALERLRAAGSIEVEEEEEKVEEKKEYSEDIKQKAWNLVKDPEFFFKFGEALRKGMFMPEINRVRYVIGEEETKLHLAVNIAAARMDMDTINFVYGNYATVKDTLVKMLFRLIGVRYVSRGYLTAAGFRYSKEINNADVLYLPEADLTGEKGRQLRFMRSDDGGFEFEYAYKNKESGLMETEIQKVGIRTIVITTNEVTFDSALESGGWLFQTDDSQELTKEVITEKLRDFVEKREVLTEEEIKVWNCAFDILTQKDDIPEFVKIPYAPNLWILFDPKRSTSRRSPEKVCELIQKIAILRRYQKPPEYRDVADVIDLFIAMRIGKAAITETVSELTTKERDVYNVVKKLESKNKADYIGANEEDRKKISNGVTVKQIAMELPFPSDTCYRLAESITDKGYFAKSKRGRENEYFIKSELTNHSEVGRTRMQSLKEPKDVLEECVKLVYGNFHLLGFGEGITNTKIIDPITGEELYLQYFSDSEEIKIGAEKGATVGKDSGKVGIRDNPRLEKNKRMRDKIRHQFRLE